MSRIFIIILFLNTLTGCRFFVIGPMEADLYENYKSLSDLEKSFKPPPNMSYAKHRLYMPTAPDFPMHGEAEQRVNESYRFICANFGTEKANGILERAYKRHGINEAWLTLTRGRIYSTGGCDFSQNPYLTWKHSGD